MKALSRAAAAVMVAVGSVLLLATPSGAAPLTTDPAVGRAGAARWMIAQLGSNGLVPSMVDPSQPDLAATANPRLSAPAAANAIHARPSGRRPSSATLATNAAQMARTPNVP